jgi:hypothetical protein
VRYLGDMSHGTRLASRLLALVAVCAIAPACAEDLGDPAPFAEGERARLERTDDSEVVDSASTEPAGPAPDADGMAATNTCPGCGEVVVDIGGKQESLPVEEIDGRPVVAGDILVGDDVRGIAGSVVALKLWPGGVVPYEIDAALEKRERITAAVRHWRDLAGIRLVPRKDEKDYVRFFKGSGRYSALGRKGGKQEISLADTCSAGSTIHDGRPRARRLPRAVALRPR